MRTNGRKRTMSAAAALSLVIALFLGGRPTARAGEAAAQPGAASEGIKVHGDWTIEVRNPDGSLASRHRFQNALTTNGAANLTGLLASQKVACAWGVVVRGSSTADNCTAASGCLSVTAGTTDFALRGVLGPRASPWDITSVSTSVSFLDAGGACPAPNPHPSQQFTQRTLDAPVAVLPEQLAQVKVVFSFS